MKFENIDKELPLVSIVIPVYNGSDYLREAIDSALSQTYKNLEIIVVNDGSCDNGATEKIALSYGECIRYIFKDNGGVSSALNEGIRHMKGEYFSWLSHDDFYAPCKIADAVNLLITAGKLHSKCITYTDGYYVNANGKRIANFKRFFKNERIYSGAEVINVMTKKGTINGCCMLIPKKLFNEVGGFDESLRFSQDSLMWYTLFLNGGELVSDNQINVMNRIHANQVTAKRKDLFFKDSLYIAKILSKPILEIDTSHKLYYQYIKRQTKHLCFDTVRYLLDFSDENQILSSFEIFMIKIWGALGYFSYNFKLMIRKILNACIVRSGRR